MARDEALLQSAIARGGVPTLRLYWWNPPTLSLGANQVVEGAVDMAALESDGYGLVRRPTGGRAILHAEELTYSVVAPAPDGGTLAAYRWLAEGLQSGLAEAGIEVQLQRMKSPQAGGIETRHPCFTAAGRYELVSGGRKVVGSAQRRRGGWLMQHGSILLGPEHLRLPRYLDAPDPEAEIAILQAGTVDCSTLLGRRITPEEMTIPFAEGFARGLVIRLEAGSVTREEQKLGTVLRDRQFGTDTWTLYGSRPPKGSVVEQKIEAVVAGHQPSGGRTP
jgi:lipoate-protein ligase A